MLQATDRAASHVDLVVAHYAADLSWVQTYHPAWERLFIYSKGPQLDVPAALRDDHKVVLQELPNVGKNVHTYLYHLVTHYDDLAEWTVFTQDDPRPHLGAVNFSDLLPPCAYPVCPWLDTVKDWDQNGRLLWETFGHPAHGVYSKPGEPTWAERYQRGEVAPAPLGINDWAQEHLGIDLKELPLVAFHPGVIYGVPRRCVLANARELYAHLLEEVSHAQDSEEAHYLERLFPLLFLWQLDPGPGRSVSRTDLVPLTSPEERLRQGRGMVYCSMPCYGKPYKETAKLFWASPMSLDGPHKDWTRIPDDEGSSLLADGFNRAWCRALNMQRLGYPVTHFAMLHSDIVPQMYWLDTLLEDLEQSGADLVAAVVPIKDMRGLTSTAIDDPDDPWDVLRRLTFKEIARLPAVFSAADCGYPNNYLLVNTGCWVCKLTEDWRWVKTCGRIAGSTRWYDRGIYAPLSDELEEVAEGRRKFRESHPLHCTCPLAAHFAITSTIQVRDNNFTEARVMSEDWHFSRALGRLGARVMVSKRIALKHMGDLPYPNDQVWGDNYTDFDLSKKFVGAVGSDAPAVTPHDALNLSEEEGQLLTLLATGKHVLEIGSYAGHSTLFLARSAVEVHCVDPFDGRGTPRPRNTLQEFRDNLRHYGLSQKVIAHVCCSKDALPDVPAARDKFDFAYIDGAHDRLSIEEDLGLVQRTLRPNGLVAFHDYSRQDANASSVVAVVDDLIRNGWQAVASVDSIVVLRPSGGGGPGLVGAQQEAGPCSAR